PGCPKNDATDGLKGLLQHKNKRPEQVGAFGLRPVSVFSHSLLRGAFSFVFMMVLFQSSRWLCDAGAKPLGRLQLK
ncbi:hypothetical protein, partial [Pseudomonas sp.]|uniref:hypothetical protein n=1 Tax=Pseudomonas sp. TaxID=306 RepID=UPI003D6FFFDA